MIMKRENGFTLIELLVAMTVIVVLLAAGVPSFKEFVKNNRVSGESGKLIIAIQVARSEALKRGSGTVICASTDQLTCSGSNDWAAGWISFSDLDQDGVLDGSGTCTSENDHLTKECIMRVKTALNKVTLTGAANHVQFRPDGLASNAPVVFTLKAVNCEHRQQRSITVSRQGHISSAELACS